MQVRDRVAKRSRLLRIQKMRHRAPRADRKREKQLVTPMLKFYQMRSEGLTSQYI